MLASVASIGTVGDSFDNSMAESVIGLYKTECVRPKKDPGGADDLELGTLNWVWWFNHTRSTARSASVTPIEYETEYYRHHTSRPQPQPAEAPLSTKPGAVQP